jgi:hypothetical protein
MGSVAEMTFVRAILLAIVATIALAGGVGPTAVSRASSHEPALVAYAGPNAPAMTDPSDPGLPPD